MLIVISKNELLAALKKAFEGIGFADGDYEDAAGMVTWLETHGLQGLAQLQTALPHLLAKPNLQMDLLQDDDRLTVVDAHGGSTLVCGGQAVDLAYTKARHNGFGAVQLSNCHNRKMIIERLVNAAMRGMACMAYWRHSVNSTVHSVVSVAPHTQYPAYQEHHFAEDQNAEDTRSLLVLCAPDLSVLREHIADVAPASSGNIFANVEPEAMQSAYQNALESGIDMDMALWDSLQKLINNVLVESTETSRAGAGD